MPFRVPHLAAAVGVAAVLGGAVTLFIRRGPLDAALMIFIVTGLTGMYALRRYARREAVHRRTGGRPVRSGDAGRRTPPGRPDDRADTVTTPPPLLAGARQPVPRTSTERSLEVSE